MASESALVKYYKDAGLQLSTVPPSSVIHVEKFDDRPSKLMVRVIKSSPEDPLPILNNLEVTVDSWCHGYRYLGVLPASSAHPAERRLKDPSILVLDVPIRHLTEIYPKFLVPELQNIATCHGIRSGRLKKADLLKAIQSHRCDARCRTVYYVFKELPRLRLRGLLDIRSRATPVQSGLVVSSSASLQSRHPFPVVETVSRPGPYSREVDSLNAEPSTVSRSMDLRESETVEGSQGRRGDRSSSDYPPHLVPITSRLKRQIIKKWQANMNVSAFIRQPCAVCSALRRPKELRCTSPDDIDLTLLRNDDLPTHLLPQSYHLASYDEAILDPAGMINTCTRGPLKVCLRCFRDLKKGKMPRFALANWLYYARERLPSEVKDAFKSMTVFEKALICRVRTNSILCRFSGLDPEDSELYRSKRRHIRGNIISTPLNIPRLNNVLPPGPSTIRDTICAIVVSKSPPTRSNIQELHPVLVRKSRVKLLIEFLLDHNPHYRLSTAFLGFSSGNLEALFSGPDDLGIPASARIGHLPLNNAVDSIASDYTDRHQGLDGIFMENVSYTLGDSSAGSYREMSLHALNWCKDGKPFLYTRSGTSLVPDIKNPNWLSWAHPNADPYGIGAFNEPRRKRRISPETQLHHLLNVRDPFFETEYEVAFDIYNIIRKATVNTSLRFSVPITSYSGLVSSMRTISKSDIEALKDKYRHNPSYQPTSEVEKNIVRLMTSISPKARGIPGGVAQRIKMRNEIRAIINQRGSPTLFITINPADHHNPIVAVLARRAADVGDVSDAMYLSLKDRMLLSLRHPVACAQFFDYVVGSFVRIVLRAGRDNRDRKGIFGVCDSYYGTVETQGRGSLHCHMLLWLKGHLPPLELAEKLKSSNRYRLRLIKWMDSISDSGFQGTRSLLNVVSNVEHSELVAEDPQHPGTITGPLIAESDTVAFETEMNEHIDDLLIKYNWHRHTGTCWKYLRPGEARTPSNCRFGMDGSSSSTTEIRHETGILLPRRRHPRMTLFNPLITFLLKCNTDIKFIGSGEDAKAFMYYVTDYISKAPLTMYAGLSALSYALRQFELKGLISSDDSEGSIRRAMTVVVNSMLGYQEFSHPQVMSFLLGNGESYTCETFQHVNWAEVIKYVTKVIESGTDHWSALTQSLTISVTSEGKTITPSNRLLDYILRPVSEPFNSMCLYRHLAWTSKVSSKTLKNEGARFSLEIHPQFASHRLKCKSRPSVPVLLGPRIHRKNSSAEELELWAKDVTVLFKPWRSPLDLRAAEASSWLATFEEYKDKLPPWENQIANNISLLLEAKHARDLRPRGCRRNHRPLATIDAVGEREDSLLIQDPFLEGNVFNLTIDQVNSEGTVYAPILDLEAILGGAVNEMLDSGLVGPAPVAEADQSGRSRAHGAHIRFSTDVEKQVALQNSYMNRCKTKFTSDTQSIPISRPLAGLQSASIPPEAEITIVKDGPNHSNIARMSAWSIVNRLIESRSLNKEQSRAFTLIAQHVIEGGEQLLMYVGGEGGTGKTYLIQTIVMLFAEFGKSHVLRLGAPTGIAASLIEGQTLHHLLSINPSRRDASPKRLVEEWKHVKYFIVDELSMVGSYFMANMSSRLKMAKADYPSESLKIFGGINMIFTGDFYQLTPPKQPSLFSHRIVHDPSFLNAKNNHGVSTLSGAFLWRQVQTVTILCRNKRQSEYGTLAKILSMMRTNRCTAHGGNTALVDGLSILEHLKRRELTYVYANNRAELESFCDAPVIAGSKTLRDAMNVRLLTYHAQRLGQEVHLYYSSDTIKRCSIQGPDADNLRNLPSRLTKESLGKLPMFPGMKVMLMENVAIPFKVVNGSEGIIKDIVYDLDAMGNRTPKVVYVEILDSLVSAPGLPVGVVPIFPKKLTIKLPYPIRGFESKSFRREQVPLMPAYSYTDYKSQGRTLDRAIIDLATARGQGVYVMLSRVTSLDGLLVLRPFPKGRITQRMSQELREELSRIEELDSQTQSRFKGEFLDRE